jgi:hypothetical protein
MQYLSGKLVRDLEAANKVFVYRTAVRSMDDAELDRFYAALRSYGNDTTLLYARYADAAHPDGTVELARPGLLIAYFDRFGVKPSGQMMPVPFATWAVVCREVYRLWQSGATRQIDDAPDSKEIVPDTEHTSGNAEAYLAQDEAMAMSEPAGDPVPYATTLQGGWREDIRALFRRRA